MQSRFPALLVLSVVSVLSSRARAADAPASALSSADVTFFETKIRPLLAEKCYKCHSKDVDKVRGGLLLDSRESVLHGGNGGPAIIPGKPDESMLIQAVRYKDEDLQMPPKGEKLSDAQIADLTEWVRRGAPDPRTMVSKGSAASYGGVGKAHWSFQPVTKPAVPAVQNAAWVRNPIDNFVLAKLEANNLTPNVAAEKTTLIRRVYFDLIGLPPSVRDVQAFLDDKSPDAYEKVVDKLLGSQFYGEHWARYWLDVARYSDTKGDAARQEDIRLPYAWTYRDYVVNAFNTDKPYNQFVFEQLAADRLLDVADQKAKEKNQPPTDDRSVLAAMGFLTLGNRFDGRVADVIADQIDVTTKAFLGLTVACARCHDHKFDPIPTKDYYSLYGVFANSRQPEILPMLNANPAPSTALDDYFAKAAELQKREDTVRAEQQAFNAEVRRTGVRNREKNAQLRNAESQLQRELGNLEINNPAAPARANALFDVTKINPRQRSVDYPVLLRGETANKGEIVPRRFLEILNPDPKKPRTEWHNGSGRPELASAIIDVRNPLTARVFVNRIWQQHWGQGFVATPDDLGNMSSAPTHPELLDYLAATFVESGWKIKALHRLIVTSAVYRQSSQNNPQFAELDPNNKFLWRYNLRRLDFEQMHDALLTITGELDPKMGGKPVDIKTEGFAKRRAIYTLIDRTNPAELLTQFDFPSPDVASGRRYETLVPQQALFLMNSPMVVEAARKLVDRPVFAELKSDEARVTALYIAIFQRMPTKQEIALGARYVKDNPEGTALPDDFVAANAPPPNSHEAKLAKIRANATAQAAKKQQKSKFSIQVGGVFEKRDPLDAWTKLAHALFQSNEAMFFD